jgi:hypothetical protein
MARVVVVLLWQCNDQLKGGLSWMKVHLTPLVTDWAVSPECKCRRVGPPPINIGVRGFGELTLSMAECEGLALVTLDKMEKWPSQLRGASEGCDTHSGGQFHGNHMFTRWLWQRSKTFFLSNTSLYKGVDLVFSDDNIEKNDGGFSKSCKNVVNDFIVCFEFTGYKLRG